MKKKLIFPVLSMCLVLMLSLTACQTSKSYSFQIDNGEKIKISLNTTDGYDLLQKEGVFTIQKDEKDILKGYFLSAEGYEQKVAAVNATKEVEMIEATPEGSPTFYCYQLKSAAWIETDFLFRVEGAQTGAMIGSLATLEEAKAAFALLEFEKLE